MIGQISEGGGDARVVESTGPLAGIRVLELGQFFSAPYTGFLLAAAGADVVKVEPPSGEQLRTRFEDVSSSYPFVNLNQGKSSLVIDLKSTRGKAFLRRLVQTADVLLENLSPGQMERLGLDLETLRSWNETLIVARTSGYGWPGPYGGRKAMDLTIQAMSGMMEVTGFSDREPVKCGGAICDILAGTHLYGGIVTALLERCRTGHVSVVEVAMLEASIPPLLSSLATAGTPASRSLRNGNRNIGDAEAPFGVYPAVDGFLAILCFRDEHWRDLTRAMEREDLAGHPDYVTSKVRGENIEQVDAIVTAWTKSRSRDAISELLDSAGIPCAPVRTMDEVMSDPHLLSRGFWRQESSTVGSRPMMSSPIAVGDWRPPLSPMHPLGSDENDVVSRWLGISATKSDS